MRWEEVKQDSPTNNLSMKQIFELSIMFFLISAIMVLIAQGITKMVYWLPVACTGAFFTVLGTVSFLVFLITNKE
jgi:magnesium-transporting ATPase (P-type)